MWMLALKGFRIISCSYTKIVVPADMEKKQSKQKGADDKNSFQIVQASQPQDLDITEAWVLLFAKKDNQPEVKAWLHLLPELIKSIDNFQEALYQFNVFFAENMREDSVHNQIEFTDQNMNKQELFNKFASILDCLGHKYMAIVYSPFFEPSPIDFTPLPKLKLSNLFWKLRKLESLEVQWQFHLKSRLYFEVQLGVLKVSLTNVLQEMEGFDQFCKLVRHHMIEMEGDLYEPVDLLQSVLFRLFHFFEDSKYNLRFTHQHELMMVDKRFIIVQYLVKKKLGEDEHKKQFEEADFEVALKEHQRKKGISSKPKQKALGLMQMIAPSKSEVEDQGLE